MNLKKCKSTYTFACLQFLVFINQGVAAGILPDPTLSTSIDRLQSVDSLLILGETIYTLSRKEPNFLISLPTDSTNTYMNPKYTGELPKRFSLASTLSSDLKLGAPFEENILVLHSDDVTLSLFSPKSGLFIWSKSIPYDRLMPPADRGGEATRFETQVLRKKFLDSWKSIDRPKLVGLSQNNFITDSKAAFFLAMTHSKEFRLLEIACQMGGEKSCEVKRACNLKDPELKKLHVTGFSLHPKKKQFAVVTNGRPEVRLYNYIGCLDSQLSKIVKLPQSLRNPISVHLDGDDDLWVGTEKSDDYLNATLYQFKNPF